MRFWHIPLAQRANGNASMQLERASTAHDFVLYGSSLQFAVNDKKNNSNTTQIT